MFQDPKKTDPSTIVSKWPTHHENRVHSKPQQIAQKAKPSGATKVPALIVNTKRLCSPLVGLPPPPTPTKLDKYSTRPASESDVEGGTEGPAQGALPSSLPLLVSGRTASGGRLGSRGSTIGVEASSLLQDNDCRDGLDLGLRP